MGYGKSQRYGRCRFDRLGVQSAWITYTSISLCLGALDFKQDIGGIYLACVLVDVQAARKLAATYTLTQAA